MGFNLHKAVAGSLEDSEEESSSLLGQFEAFFGGAKKEDKTPQKPNDDSKEATTAKEESRFRRVVTKIRQTSFVPALVTFWIGYRVGLWKQAGAVAQTANRSTLTLRDSLRFWALSLALGSLLVREFWRNVPFWLKRQLPRLLLPEVLWKRIVPKEKQSMTEDNGRMTSLPTIVKKLQSLFALATEKLGLEDQESTDNIETSMLVLLRLARQIKAHRPDLRDAEYQSKETTEITEYHQRMFEFADAAYDELPDEQALRDFLDETYGYELLRHDMENVPGAVAHYIAVNRKTKDAIIGVKGTSSLEDVLTDCCGVGVDYEGMRCHDGILTASKKLAADLETVLVDLLIPRGYSVTLTGHSLVCTFH